LDILVDFLGRGMKRRVCVLFVWVCGVVGIDRVPIVFLPFRPPAGPDQSSQVVVVVCMLLSV